MNQAREYAASVYRAVDAMDETALVKFLTKDCVFVFGNGEPVKGRADVATYVKGFYSMIAGIRHDLAEVWAIDDRIFIRLTVTYTRKDNKEMSFPGVVIWALRDGLISDFRIYVDISPLFTR